MVIEKDKEISHNPFLYTRIMAKLESRKEPAGFLKKLIPALTVSLILMLAITGGVFMGRLYSGSNPGYSDDLQEEISYLNDIEQEPIETFFLIPNDENNE